MAIGAGLGVFIGFFVFVLASALSLSLRGPALGRLDDGWLFAGVLAITPIIGALTGYLIGIKRRFKTNYYSPDS